MYNGSREKDAEVSYVADFVRDKDNSIIINLIFMINTGSPCFNEIRAGGGNWE